MAVKAVKFGDPKKAHMPDALKCFAPGLQLDVGTGARQTPNFVSRTQYDGKPTSTPGGLNQYKSALTSTFNSQILLAESDQE